MRTRIAPTPSGFLHRGNGAAFVLAWKLAREAGGKVLLRIDDLDAEHTRTAYVGDIFESLRWLGVDWDEGPRDPGQLKSKWSQQLRLGKYDGLIEKLRADGQLYACDCSRALIARRGAKTEYDNHCRDRGLDLDAPDAAWRLRLPIGASVSLREWPSGEIRELRLEMPDPVIRQRNGRPAYQIASLSDDVDFNIDLVVRGADLLPSTLIQLHLASLLGLDAFSHARFLHHPLIMDDAGGKLSKSKGSSSLKAMRESGSDPQEIHALADRLLREAGAWPG